MFDKMMDLREWGIGCSVDAREILKAARSTGVFIVSLRSGVVLESKKRISQEEEKRFETVRQQIIGGE